MSGAIPAAGAEMGGLSVAAAGVRPPDEPGKVAGGSGMTVPEVPVPGTGGVVEPGGGTGGGGAGLGTTGGAGVGPGTTGGAGAGATTAAGATAATGGGPTGCG